MRHDRHVAGFLLFVDARIMRRLLREDERGTLAMVRLTGDVDEPLVDAEEGDLCRLAALPEAVDLLLEAA